MVRLNYYWKRWLIRIWINSKGKTWETFCSWWQKLSIQFKNFAQPHQTHLLAWAGPYHGQDPLGWTTRLKNNLTARFSLGMGVCSFDWTVTGTDVSGKRSENLGSLTVDSTTWPPGTENSRDNLLYFKGLLYGRQGRDIDLAVQCALAVKSSRI